MLFNSHEFILWFLPVVLVAVFVGRNFLGVTFAKFVIIGLSMYFYGSSRLNFLGVLVGSTGVVYLASLAIYGTTNVLRRRLFFTIGLMGCLGNLLLWKYTGKVIQFMDHPPEILVSVASLAMPLGISFYSFQQLIYLIDVNAGHVRERPHLVNFVTYLFFFPQLIVGPIVRYDELLPQIERAGFGRLRRSNILLGFSIFVLGLGKKVILADQLATMVDPVYEQVGFGEPICAMVAWGTALGFAAQLYFDFSGYSDMAIGLARMFGLKLPFNFYSPYRALSIGDFWRRWHITLTRMIRSYVFNPISITMGRWLSGQGVSAFRLRFSIMSVASTVAFVAIGLWHGLTETFLVFGLLHSAYVVAEVVLESGKLGFRYRGNRYLTFVLVVLSLVLFRSPNMEVALRLYGDMFSLNGFFSEYGFRSSTYGTLLLLCSLAICLWGRNTQQLLDRYEIGIATYRPSSAAPRLRRRFGSLHWLALGAIFAVSLVLLSAGESVFLYFDF